MRVAAAIIKSLKVEFCSGVGFVSADDGSSLSHKELSKIDDRHTNMVFSARPVHRFSLFEETAARQK